MTYTLHYQDDSKPLGSGHNLYVAAIGEARSWAGQGRRAVVIELDGVGPYSIVHPDGSVSDPQ